jgi:aspartyl-tRNA synthetase
MNWIDLRDRWNNTINFLTRVVLKKRRFELAKTLGREFVIQVKVVIEREAKNIPTGEIEILVTELTILNAALHSFHYRR